MEMPWNKEQRKVFDLMEDALTANRRDPVPRLVRVEGRSRAGKSALILEMARRAREHFAAGDLEHDPVLVVAPTNAAAAAVRGRTIHWGFCLPPSDEEPWELLDNHRARLAAVRVVLVDECNMVPATLLRRMDRRLRTVSGENKPFGGCVVIAFGDHESWGPVPSRPGYQPDPAITWTGFEVVTLEETHIEDVSFRHALSRLARDAVSEKDALRFATRRFSDLPAEERLLFENVPHVFISADDAQSYNARRRSAERANLPPSTEVREVVSTMDPYTSVQLYKGARVLVAATIKGVATAGDLGVVTRLVLSRSGACDGVELALDRQASQEVLISKDGEGRFPLAAGYHAATLPKALGLHYTRVVVHLPDNEWGGKEFVYGAVSRARDWSALAFDDQVPQPKKEVDPVVEVFKYLDMINMMLGGI